MKTNLLVQNSKIKKSNKRTFNFAIPAFKDKDGRKTCPNAGVCAVGCYAQSGAYRFSNVLAAHHRNLKCTESPHFVTLILNELSKKRVERLRIHDSGDFYLTDKDGKLNTNQRLNTETHYIDKWISIMLLAPTVQFYAYTKMVDVFKKYQRAGVLPKNFILIYSQGGTQDTLINTSIDRHSKVFETKAQLKREHYADASNQDDVALKANPRIGLIYHGTKKYTNTAWNRTK